LQKTLTEKKVDYDPSYAEYLFKDLKCTVKLDKALYSTTIALNIWCDNRSSKLKTNSASKLEERATEYFVLRYVAKLLCVGLQ
jgi:hypothetical protein